MQMIYLETWEFWNLEKKLKKNNIKYKAYGADHGFYNVCLTVEDAEDLGFGD